MGTAQGPECTFCKEKTSATRTPRCIFCHRVVCYSCPCDCLKAPKLPRHDTKTLPPAKRAMKKSTASKILNATTINEVRVGVLEECADRLNKEMMELIRAGKAEEAVIVARCSRMLRDATKEKVTK